MRIIDTTYLNYYKLNYEKCGPFLQLLATALQQEATL